MIKCKNLRMWAEDRNAWRRKIDEAKVQGGLYRHRRRRRWRRRAENQSKLRVLKNMTEMTHFISMKGHWADEYEVIY
jgi:hypothetical protein